MPIICVECSKIWSEELEIAYLDYCEDCASPETETFNCPECEIDFIGDIILNAFNFGQPLCYECYDKSQAAIEKTTKTEE